MARLSLTLLGPLQVTLDGQPVRAAAYDKVWALLAYLALSGAHATSRDSLTALLWPEQPENAARTNLRQALARLRQTIGDQTAEPPFLLIDRETLQCNPAGDYQLDVAEFTALCAACDTHRHRRRETCLPCAQRHERAVALYRGRFLDQFFLPDSTPFEEWALLVREPLHQRMLAALGQLTAYYERRGDYQQARRYSERQLALDPWREESHQQLMRLLVLSGQRSEALVQYERCRSVLAAELGIEPAAETTAYYERIRAAGFDAALAGDLLTLPAGSRNNLPWQPTPFVGRDTELVALGDLLANPACRLVTLVGPGGIGKTRLALQAASDQRDAFPHGVAFAALAPLSSAEFLVPAIAEALNVTLSGRDDPRTELVGYLHAKELLLILDNCEHLLAGAGLFGEILQHAPGVTLLATSRERLNLQAEWLFEVQGLPVPEEWGKEAGDGAVTLFMQSARRLRAGFVPLETEKATVVRICQLVAGMPLAVELAAAWVRVLSCVEIADEIERSLDILAAESRDLPTRQHSMQAVFDHSWKLLLVEEQQVFARLSVFRSGFQRDAAEQVAEAGLHLLSALVDKSLVRANPTGRYELHELARQYAAEKLREARDAEATSNRHLVYFVTLAERGAPELTGPRQPAWLDRLEVEHDNLRAALAWGQAAGETDLALRLAGSVWRFWFLRGHLIEGETWLRQLLAQPGGAPQLRAAALADAGFITLFRGQYDHAAAWIAESLALARKAGDQRLTAFSLSLLGESRYHVQGLAQAAPLLAEGLDIARASRDNWLIAFALAQSAQMTSHPEAVALAAALAEESVTLARAIGDRWLLAFALYRLGSLATYRHDFVAARALHEEGLAMRRELGDRLGIAYALLGLGNAANAQGDFAEADARMEERLALERDLANGEGVVHALNDIGWMDYGRGDYARAAARFEEGLALSRHIGYVWGVGSLFDNLGQVASAQGNYDQAGAYFENSLVFYQQLVDEAQTVLPEITAHRRELAGVHVRLGQVDYLQGRLPGARTHFESGLKILRELNDENGMGWVQPWLGRVAYRGGDLDQARALIEAGLAIHNSDEHWPELAFALLSCGDVARAQGDPAHAAELYARSLRMVVEHRVRPDVAQYLEGFAKLALGAGQAARAVRLFGAAQALRDHFSTPVPPVEQAEYGRSVSQLRDQLQPAAFSAAWDEGLGLSWQQAAAYALET